MKNKLLLLAMGFALTTQMIMAQVPSYVPTNGLVGYWPFNGNANDESGNGNNGNRNQVIEGTDRYGNPNSSFYFDGLTSYIYGTGVNLPQGDSPRTVSLWVKTTGGFFANTGGYTGAIFDYGTLENNKRFSVLLVDNDLTNYFSSYNNDFNPNTSVVSNFWTNIIWVFSSTNLKLYLNGVLSNDTTIFNINTTGQNFVIGNTIPNSNGIYEYYKGAIDDIGIWNRALTQQEITNLYNSANTNECLTMTINTGVLSTSPVTYTSTVNIYPNPANDQITIDCGNLDNVVGWNIKITNMLGQEVFNQPMNTQQYVVPLNSWTGQGMYFVKIINAQNEVVNIKKIILQ
jgi:hypothetical protein